MPDEQEKSIRVMRAANWTAFQPPLTADGACGFTKPNGDGIESCTVTRDGLINGFDRRDFARYHGFHELPVLMTSPEILELIR